MARPARFGRIGIGVKHQFGIKVEIPEGDGRVQVRDNSRAHADFAAARFFYGDNVSVYTAEASRYVLFSNTGIFDPLAEAALIRAHNEQPAASQLSGAQVTTSDTTDFSARVRPLSTYSA